MRGVWKVSMEMQQHSNAKVNMSIDTSVQYVHAYIHKCTNSNSCKCFDDGHVRIFILYCSLLGLVIVSAIRTHACMSSSPATPSSHFYLRMHTECSCDPIGSMSLVCHHASGQCPCKNGVDGQMCDVCQVCTV